MTAKLAKDGRVYAIDEDHQRVYASDDGDIQDSDMEEVIWEDEEAEKFYAEEKIPGDTIF